MATRSGVQNIIAAKRRSSSGGNSVSRSDCRVGLTSIANSASGTAGVGSNSKIKFNALAPSVLGPFDLSRIGLILF
jgi:hypothetical protein